MKKKKLLNVLVPVGVILVFIILFLSVALSILIDSHLSDKRYKYLESLDGQTNSSNFLHIGMGDICLNGKFYDYGLRTPYSTAKSPKNLNCNYFGATDDELFYYLETDDGIDFYKSNYTNYTYEMTRSFNYEEILYHKSEKVIYRGKDGKTYIFDAFDLTDDNYEGEITTDTSRYTVTEYSAWFYCGSLKHQSFIIEDNITGEKKDIRKLKKTIEDNEHIKKLNAKYVEYVFCNDDNIYIVYDCLNVVVTFAFDFESESLTLVNWDKLEYGCGIGKTWYLDRVKFEE